MKIAQSKKEKKEIIQSSQEIINRNNQLLASIATEFDCNNVTEKCTQ